MREQAVIVRVAVFTVAVFVYFATMALAEECRCPKCAKPDFVSKTAEVFTGTTQSAVGGTACITQTAVTDTAGVPATAIQATKDTANTAFNTADAAIKAFTGDN